MLYLIYLLGIILILIKGIGSLDQLIYYQDFISFVLVIFPCALILFCSRSLKAFGRAFLLMFKKKPYPLPQYRESLDSVKMVIYTSMIFGGLCFMISLINCFKVLDLVSFEDLATLYLDTSVALLSPFYSLIICAILLPPYFCLKKHTQ